MRFSLTSVPSQTFFLPREVVEGDVPPRLCKCYRFYPRTGTEGFPAQSVLKLLYIPHSLFHLIKIAVLGSPILCAHHSAPGEEGGRPSCLTPFESPFRPEPKNCLPDLLIPRPMLQWQEPAASLPASNCQVLPEPTSRPSLIYKYANLHLFWYANGDMTNS